MLFDMFKTKINNDLLNLVFKLNNSVSQFCNYSIISMERQLFFLETWFEKGEFIYNNGTEALVVFISIYELENYLIMLSMMDKNHAVEFKQCISKLHAEISQLNNLDFISLDDSIVKDIKKELARISDTYPL